MIRSILVGLDGSPHASRVLAVAADLAGHYGARIIPMQAIVMPQEFPPAAHVEHADGLEAFLRDQGRAALDALTSAIDRARVDPVIIAFGEPWKTILDVAERSSVDLIVIGSHGYGGFDRLLGTTAARVVNHAQHDVFVVRRFRPPATPSVAIA